MKTLIRDGSFWIGIGVSVVVIGTFTLMLLGIDIKVFSPILMFLGISLIIIGVVKL